MTYMVAHAPNAYMHADSGAYAAGRGGVGALKVLPIFVFAYTCHQVRLCFYVCTRIDFPCVYIRMGG